MENSNRTMFRAYNKDWKMMTNDITKIDFDGDKIFSVSFTIETTDGQKHTEVWEDIGVDLVLMQSTGLLDCNGKPIFESDIVKQKNVDRLGIIKFGDYMVDGEDYYSNYATAGFYIDYGKNDDDTSYIRGDEVEIIGSIYENPELLKNK